MHNPEILKEQQPLEVHIPEIWADKEDLYKNLFLFLSVLGNLNPADKIADLVYYLKKEKNLDLQNLDSEKAKKALLYYFFKDRILGLNSAIELKKTTNLTFRNRTFSIEIEFGTVKKYFFKINGIQITENGQDVTEKTYQFVFEAFSLVMNDPQSQNLSELLSKMFTNQVLKANFVNNNRKKLLTFDLGSESYSFGNEVIQNPTEHPAYQSYEDPIKALKDEEKNKTENQENEMPIFLFYAFFALSVAGVSTAAAYEDGADILEILAAFNIPFFSIVFLAVFAEFYLRNNRSN